MPRPAGTQNHNGQSVFAVAPVEGVLDPGAVQDFTLTFSPDHESLYFSDLLRVVLFEKVRPSSPACGRGPSSPECGRGSPAPGRPTPLGRPRAHAWGSEPRGAASGERPGAG